MVDVGQVARERGLAVEQELSNGSIVNLDDEAQVALGSASQDQRPPGHVALDAGYDLVESGCSAWLGDGARDLRRRLADLTR